MRPGGRGAGGEVRDEEERKNKALAVPDEKRGGTRARDARGGRGEGGSIGEAGGLSSPGFGKKLEKNWEKISLSVLYSLLLLARRNERAIAFSFSFFFFCLDILLPTT